jgi:hypothetical protein
MNTTETRKLEAFRHRSGSAENCFFDHSQETDNANVLGEGPNKSRRRKPWHDRWWVIAAEVGLILAAICCALHEMDCF